MYFIRITTAVINELMHACVESGRSGGEKSDCEEREEVEERKREEIAKMFEVAKAGEEAGSSGERKQRVARPEVSQPARKSKLEILI